MKSHILFILLVNTMELAPEYATLSANRYQPQMLARTNRMDWNAIADLLRFEIERVKNLTP